MKPFWVVFCNDYYHCEIKFFKKAEAFKEAKKLAIEFPFRRYVILEAICEVKKADVTYTPFEGHENDIADVILL